MWSDGGLLHVGQLTTWHLGCGGWPLAALGLVLVARAIWGGRRLFVTLRTLPAQAWTPALARRLAHWVKTRPYSDEAFFGADGAGEPWIERRRQGIGPLGRILPGRV